MKKYILTALVSAMSLFNSSLYSQSLNGVPVKELDVNYIEIMGVQSGFSSKVKIVVDYGQKVSIGTKNEEKFIMDSEGKIVKFDSMMDALNFFYDNNFEYVNSYAYAVGNSTVYHHLLKKKSK